MPAPVHPYSEYGVALRTLRSARSWLGRLLFLCVVAQFIGFALFYWTQQPYKEMKPGFEKEEISWLDRARDLWQRSAVANPTTPSATAPAFRSTDPFYPGTIQSRKLNVREQWDTTYTMVVPVTQILGLMAAASQTIVVFLTLLLILVAQAPGVVHVTRSLIWSVLLLFTVLPWQYVAPGFPVPGILYHYQEMLDMIGPMVVPGEHVYRYQWFLLHARFIFWPLLGMLVLLISSERYRAGLALAIGHPLQSMMQPRQPNAGLGMSAPRVAPTISPVPPKPAEKKV